MPGQFCWFRVFRKVLVMNSENQMKAVLLVEDDPLLGSAMCRIMERMECNVVTAATCCDAEEAWLRQDYDLILVDYRLPDGLGLDLISVMRSAGRRDQVYCLTAEAEAVSEEDAEKLRIGAIWSKPVDPELLREALQKKVFEQVADCSKRRRAGRFLIVERESGSADFPTDCRRLCRGENWVAVKIGELDELSEKQAQLLRNWAVELSKAGGRLCLLLPPEGCPVEQELASCVDTARNEDELAAHSRRLTGALERRELLAMLVDDK